MHVSLLKGILFHWKPIATSAKPFRASLPDYLPRRREHQLKTNLHYSGHFAIIPSPSPWKARTPELNGLEQYRCLKR